MAKKKADPSPVEEEEIFPADEGETREDESLGDPEPREPVPLVATRTFNTPKGRPAIVTRPLPPVGVEVDYVVGRVTYRGTPVAHEWWKDVEMAVFDSVTPIKIEEE